MVFCGEIGLVFGDDSVFGAASLAGVVNDSDIRVRGSGDI